MNFGGKENEACRFFSRCEEVYRRVSDAASKGRVVVERTCNDKDRKVGRACIIYGRRPIIFAKWAAKAH